MKKEQTLKKSGIDIFLSHSSVDQQIASRLIELITMALNKPINIRCTSVQGFKPDAGVNFDIQLGREIAKSRVFICLLTPSSVKSTYVLLEIGGRMWGSEKKVLIPLIGSKSGVKLLKGPLKNINCLNICHEAEIYQFINQLGKKLGIKPVSPAVYADKVKVLAAMCRV